MMPGRVRLSHGIGRDNVTRLWCEEAVVISFVWQQTNRACRSPGYAGIDKGHSKGAEPTLVGVPPIRIPRYVTVFAVYI